MRTKSHYALLTVLFFLGITLSASIGFAAFGATPAKEAVMVINSGYRLVIESEKGTIASLRSTFGIDHELLIPGHAGLPLFKIEFMNDHGEFKTVTSSEAKAVHVSKIRGAEGETITIDYEGIGGLPVDAHVTIRCPSQPDLNLLELGAKQSDVNVDRTYSVPGD